MTPESNSPTTPGQPRLAADEREIEFVRLSRALRVLRQCTGKLAHASDEMTLLADICRLLVDTGGYAMAWVGYAIHDEEKSVKCAAQSGNGQDYLGTVQISWDEARETGQGPTGTAIRLGIAQVNQNYLTNPRMAPWRDVIARHGYQSSAALPLSNRQGTFGALMVYAREPDAFGNEELTLLEDLADSLAFGVSALRVNRQHEADQASLALQVRRAEALLALQRAADSQDEIALMQGGLAAAESLTESRISFIHFVNDDEETIELVTWSKRTLEGYCHAAFDKHYAVSQAGIWADALRQKTPVTFNDYAAVTHKRGLPAGHAGLDRLVTVPVLHRGKVVMLAGVGNKATDYGSMDVETVQLFANEVWHIVQQRRATARAARFSRMLEQSKREILAFDSQSLRFLDANLGVRDNLGYDLEALQKLTPLDLHPAFTADSFATLIAPLRSGKTKEITYSTEHRRKDGSTYPAEVHLELSGESPACIVAVVSDISERRRAESALAESEARFALFMNTLPAAAFIKDEAGVTLFANRYLEDLMGTADWRGKSAHELFPPEIAERMTDDDRRSLEAGYVVSEEEVPGGEGRTKYFQTHKFAIPRKGQRPLLGGIALDITERKRAEAELIKLSLAVEQSPESIVITDLNARIEYVNEAFLRSTGYTREEVIGRNPRILQSGEARPELYASLWRTLTQGKMWQGEFSNKRKNGEIYLESARISPVRQPDGRVTHYLAIKADITEQHRLAEGILESKVLLQRVIDSTPDWIFVKDSEHRFILVNEPFAKAFGQGPESLIGHRDTDFLPIELCEGDLDMGLPGLHDYDDVVFGGQSIHLHGEKIALDEGRVRVFDTFKGPLRDAAGRIYAILCYRRDISDRYNTEQKERALENQLRQAQKMELIGHLTGGIAHDFNNILASMLGFTELLQMSAEIKGNPKLMDHLHEILHAGIRAKELVAQLLTFSHRRETTTESIPVTPIIREVATLLRATLPASISVKTDLARGLPEALISPVNLHQVLMNLGVNARDAISGKGTIRISATSVVLAGENTCASCHKNFSGDYVLISVVDNGAGIAPGTLPRVFDPFFTTKGVGRGSGLGLSVLHGIVHSADGHIEAHSTPGFGTEFRIYLPAQLQQAAAPVSALRARQGKTSVRGHVLIVDDETSIVVFMKELIETLGCRVTGVTSPTEALRVFREHPDHIDMVISDQSMPDLSGVELARALLDLRPELPVILSTGNSSAVDDEIVRQLGIRRVLIKPVPARVLLDVVSECLRGNAAR